MRKKWLRNKRKFLLFFKRNRNKKIIILLSFLLVIIIILYYLFSFVFVSSFSICLEKLRRTYDNEIICRDACFNERNQYGERLSNRIEKRDSNKEKIEEIILSEDEDIEFRKNLMNILVNVYGKENVPSFLNDYFLEEDGNEDIKKEVINLYDFSQGLEDYFHILVGDFSLKIKRAAVVKISNCENKEDYSLEQVEKIRELIFNENISDKLRQDLVLLLANYKDKFNFDVVSIWEEVYNSNFTNDNISRAFVADFLDKDEVVVDEEEWLNFYSN